MSSEWIHVVATAVGALVGLVNLVQVLRTKNAILELKLEISENRAVDRQAIEAWAERHFARRAG